VAPEHARKKLLSNLPAIPELDEFGGELHKVINNDRFVDFQPVRS